MGSTTKTFRRVLRAPRALRRRISRSSAPIPTNASRGVLQTIYDVDPEIDKHPNRWRTRYPEIVEPEFWDAYELAKPYSMLHVPGFYNIFQAIRYIADRDLPGAFVECGCFLGGSSIFITLMRDHFDLDRKVHVFDTFAGAPKTSTDGPDSESSRTPTRFSSFFDATRSNFEAVCGLRDVVFHDGDVVATVRGFEPEPLALVRLDTDWYESTKAELEVFYPLLVSGGVLVVDDYGGHEGSRRATDEYLAALASKPLLNRIDAGIWAGVKP